MYGFADAASGGDVAIERAGYPLNRAYGVSKAGVIAFTRALAAELAERENTVDQGEERIGEEKDINTQRGILVNACCPGWVRTDMTKGRGVKTVDQGAETPVMLALENLGGRSGGYWTEGKEEEW